MRIIGGELRGRRLLAPEGRHTRPFTDRAKQSLFDIIAPVLPGAVVYDCFAGTGSLGLESLSRGAARAVFFEAERSALALLARNIAALGLRDRCTVVGGDVFRWARRLEDAAAGPLSLERCDVAFLDPPFHFATDRADDLRHLAAVLARAAVTPGGLVVFRHRDEDTLTLPGLSEFDRRTYGKMAVTLLRR